MAAEMNVLAPKWFSLQYLRSAQGWPPFKFLLIFFGTLYVICLIYKKKKKKKNIYM